MKPLPFRTRQEKNGPSYTIDLGPRQLQVVQPPDFADLRGQQPVLHRGPRFEMAPRAECEKPTILIKNVQFPRREEVHRDDAWHRRRELAGALPPLLEDNCALAPRFLTRLLPVSLLAPSYLAAFPPDASEEDVLRAFHHNTQGHIERRVRAALEGTSTYDADRYATRGPDDPDYSHEDHFAWLYAHQILPIEWTAAARGDREITVLDLATGPGHFLVTLARRLEEKGLLDRVRLIGVDLSERDMRFGREMLSPGQADRIRFVRDDVECPRFADRLRRFGADFIVANHVLEHLAGPDLKNRFLHDWLLAARTMLSISVPLEKDLARSIADHRHQFSSHSLQELARQMELRTSYAVEATDIERTSDAGLCTWWRKADGLFGARGDDRLITLSPRPTVVRVEALFDDFAREFAPEEFLWTRVAPKIGEIEDKATFSTQGVAPRQVRQLVIKMPGSQVRVPRELAQFAEAVQIILDHHKAANPDYERTYAYLNVFRGITGHASYRGLSLNCHGDQLQGLRPEYAYTPDWSYIVSDGLPTLLFAQPFDLSEAVERFRLGETVNLYRYLNEQARADCLYRTVDYGIYLLSPYVVHSAAPADQDTERVFMKIAFSTKRFFDNRELRRNPAFDIEEWYQADTVGFVGGWLSHEHWNERYLKDDVCLDWPGR